MRGWFWRFPLAIAFLSELVSGHPESCVGACELSLGHVVFPDVNASLGYHPTQCGSRLRATSILACVRTCCGQAETQAGLTRLSGECELYANITFPPLSFIDNITDGEIARFRRVDLGQLDTGLQVDEPVLPNQALFDQAFKTQDAWNNSVVTRHQYGNAMFYFWAFVVAVGLGNRFLMFRPAVASTTQEKSANITTNTITTRSIFLLKRWITISAAFSDRCSEPVGWCTIPPRLQTSILLLFTAINVYLSCISYEVFKGNLYWSVTVQWARYIGDRTSVISAANLPIIWLFATRNNVLLYLTGWSFDTAIQFHRWVARISTIEAVVHSVAYTVVSFEMGGWDDYWSDWIQRYWYMGALATVAMCLICAFSVHPMRHYFYELFLFLHISLGILAFLGMYYHVEIFNGDYNWYLWPCLIIWLSDRLARTIRLAYLDFPLQRSSLSYDSQSNVVWLSVPIPTNWKPKPGEYYFLYLPYSSTFYENHPFTMSSWSRSLDHNDRGQLCLNFLIRPYDGFTKRLARLGRSARHTSGGNSTATKVQILAEGPYGPSHDLKHLDSLTFVVGGSGVAVALAYLMDLCECVKKGNNVYQARKFTIVWAVQHLAFFEQVYEQEIKPRLDELDLGPNDINFDLDIYVTRSKMAEDAAVHTPLSVAAIEYRSSGGRFEEDASDQSPLLSPPASRSPARVPSSPASNSVPHSPTYSPSTTADVKTGCSLSPNTTLDVHFNTRPDIYSIVFEAARRQLLPLPQLDPTTTEADLHPGYACTGQDSKYLPRVGILVCGPPSLADSTRASVVKVLDETRQANVEFWSESYTW